MAPHATAWLLVGVLTFVGLVLRVEAAGGDLWLDEIWSLKLVGGIKSAGGVFWGISSDNNHYLNSLWLFLVGPGQSSLVYRSPAVLFGTLSVPFAARIGFRQNPATGLVAAALTACTFPLVNYGSEARGYAGLILATFAAIDSFGLAIEPMLAAQSPAAAPRRAGGMHRWALGAALGFGALSHFTMVAALAVLGLTALIRLLEAGRSPSAAIRETIGLFLPSLVMLLPVVAAIALGVLVHGGFDLGGTSPFEASSFLAGFGGLIRLIIGLPSWLPVWVALIAAAFGLAMAFKAKLIPGQQHGLVLAGVAIVPGLMFAAQLPNLGFPRYFLVSGIVLLLCEADVIGALWDRRTIAARCGALALMLGSLVGQSLWTASLLHDRRGSYSAVLDIMEFDGRLSYASSNRFRTQTVVDYFAAQRGARFDYVDPASFCRNQPDWYIDADQVKPEMPSRVELGPTECRATFLERASFPGSALSGMRWTLYRRITG